MGLFDRDPGYNEYGHLGRPVIDFSGKTSPTPPPGSGISPEQWAGMSESDRSIAISKTSANDPNQYRKLMPREEFYLGGSKQGSQDYFSSLGQKADESQGRPGAQIDTSLWERDRAQEQEARGAQNVAGGYWLSGASGQLPSAAEALYRGALDKSIRAGQSAAASARGGGYAASAANQAAVQQATQSSMDAANQLAALRAQEQERYVKGLSDWAGQLRAGDQSRAAGSSYVATQQAGFDDRALTRNDAREMGYAQLGQDARRADLEAGKSFWLGHLGAYGQDKDRLAATERADDDRLLNAAGKIAGGVTGLLSGSGSGSPAPTAPRPPRVYGQSQDGSYWDSRGYYHA